MVIGVVGLGTMGGATARRMLAAGLTVHGYDPEKSATDAFIEAGGVAFGSPADLAAGCDVILVWLPTPQSLLDTAVGITESAHEGLLVVEMGTLTLASKDRARAILLHAGVDMLDAPVSGSGRLAESGELTVYASGSETSYELARPVFASFGTSRYVGPFGHGSAMKYIANLLVAVHTAAAAEAHSLGAAAGLDPEMVQQVIADGVGSSRMWELRGNLMVADDYDPPGGRLDNLAKDIEIIAGYARRMGSATPLLDVAAELFAAAEAAGLGHLDAAAVRRVLPD